MIINTGSDKIKINNEDFLDKLSTLLIFSLRKSWEYLGARIVFATPRKNVNKTANLYADEKIPTSFEVEKIPKAIIGNQGIIPWFITVINHNGFAIFLNL